MATAENKVLCRMADIPTGGAIEVTAGDDEHPIIILREGDAVYAYLNVCPHQGRELNYAPGKFMVRGGVLVCAHHGASYRVSDGACLGGPCRGVGLHALPVAVHDGNVELQESLGRAIHVERQ